MRYLLLIFLMIIVLCSCMNTNNDSKRISSKGLKKFYENRRNFKEINIDKLEPVIRIDSIFTQEISYIKLQTDSNCQIGKIDKIIFDDSLVFIVDKEISKCIFIYDLLGKFQGKIGKLGISKESFADIQDVVLNPEEKQILVLDILNRKINYYDYEGNYLKTISSPYPFESFFCLDSLTIVTTNNFIDNFHLISSSIDGHLYSKGFYYNIENKNNLMPFSQLWKFGNDIYYNFHLSDTIYRVKKDTLYADFYINLNGRNIPYSEKDPLTFVKYKELISKYGFINRNFISLKDYVYLLLHMPDGELNVFYSKKTCHLISGYNISSKNPLLALFYRPIARFNENTLVTLIYSADFNKFKSIQNMKGWNTTDKELRKNFLKIFENTHEDDNPILLFYTMKRF